METKKTYNEILNTYLFGSRLYGSHTENSDYDYVYICKNDQRIYNALKEKFNDINIHIFTIDMFQRKLDNMDIVALECLFSPENFKSESITFDFNYNDQLLRKFVATITSNSWVKCKKKITVMDDYDLNIGLKSLFHSIRIFDYAIQIAKTGKITDWTNYNYVLEDLFKLSESYQYEELWNQIDAKYRGLFLSLKSELKKLCTKRSEKIDSNFLSKKLKKYKVPQEVINEIYKYFES